GGKEFQRRFAALGLAKGCEIEVLKSSTLKGPVIVSFFGAKLALGHGMADKIMVKEIPPK
ncbi:MAG: FeoA family protein, partial [Candidatus Nanoarchaeia archaeon]